MSQTGQETAEDLPAVVAHMWAEYKDSGGDVELRNRIVLHYMSLVKYVASRVAVGLPPNLQVEDLVSYGTFGLLDAIEKFSLDKGVKFETYAISRIRGSIIDELRALDWVPRSIRSKARDVERVYAEMEAELGRLPEEHEVADRLGISVPDLWILLSQVAAVTVTTMETVQHDGEESENPGLTNILFDASQDPEGIFATVEVKHLLADAVDSMSERSKQIVALYYLEELTLSEIGVVLGVTESRVCQLQTKMIQSLREALAGRVAA